MVGVDRAIGQFHRPIRLILPVISFPVASELILPEIRTRQCRFPTINPGRETALPCPLYHSGAAGIDITRNQDTVSCRFPTINRAVLKFVFTVLDALRQRNRVFYLIFEYERSVFVKKTGFWAPCVSHNSLIPLLCKYKRHFTF